MLDTRLRPAKERVLAPLVVALGSMSPTRITGVGLVAGLAAAAAAAAGLWWLALFLFIVNRVIDGVDGDVARARSTSSDHGGYADMVVDTIVYAAIPLGAAAGSDIDYIWPITALLIASFYVNTITWSYLAALIEKRGRMTSDASPTSIVMPPGLVEGTETIAFFVVMLAIPGWLDWTMGIMAAAVAVGAAARFVSARQRLQASASREQRVDA